MWCMISRCIIFTPQKKARTKLEASVSGSAGNAGGKGAKKGMCVRSSSMISIISGKKEKGGGGV